MKLTTGEIAFLAGKFPAQTVIGLFSNINQTPDGTEAQSLTEKGVLKDGRLTAEVGDILAVVAGARQCSRLIVKNSFLLVEKYTYRTSGGLVLVENDAGKLVFTAAKELTRPVLEVAELIGMSKLKTADVELLADAEEIQTLLALIDLTRKNALLTYAGQEISGFSLSLSEIQSQLAIAAPNSLVRLLRENASYAPPAAGAVAPLLQKLVDNGCVTMQEGGYALTGEYALFAKSFLIPETVLLIETFRLGPDGGLTIAGALGLSAGVNDLALLLFDGGQIELSSLSAFQMLRTVQSFLECPDIGEEGDAGKADRFCPGCGAKTEGGAAFCANCGTRLG